MALPTCGKILRPHGQGYRLIEKVRTSIAAEVDDDLFVRSQYRGLIRITPEGEEVCRINGRGERGAEMTVAQESGTAFEIDDYGVTSYSLETGKITGYHQKRDESAAVDQQGQIRVSRGAQALTLGPDLRELRGQFSFGYEPDNAAYLKEADLWFSRCQTGRKYRFRVHSGDGEMLYESKRKTAVAKAFQHDGQANLILENSKGEHRLLAFEGPDLKQETPLEKPAQAAFPVATGQMVVFEDGEVAVLDEKGIRSDSSSLLGRPFALHRGPDGLYALTHQDNIHRVERFSSSGVEVLYQSESAPRRMGLLANGRVALQLPEGISVLSAQGELLETRANIEAFAEDDFLDSALTKSETGIEPGWSAFSEGGGSYPYPVSYDDCPEGPWMGGDGTLNFAREVSYSEGLEELGLDPDEATPAPSHPGWNEQLPIAGAEVSWLLSDQKERLSFTIDRENDTVQWINQEPRGPLAAALSYSKTVRNKLDAALALSHGDWISANYRFDRSPLFFGTPAEEIRLVDDHLVAFGTDGSLLTREVGEAQAFSLDEAWPEFLDLLEMTDADQEEIKKLRRFHQDETRKDPDYPWDYFKQLYRENGSIQETRSALGFKPSNMEWSEYVWAHRSFPNYASYQFGNLSKALNDAGDQRVALKSCLDLVKGHLTNAQELLELKQTSPAQFERIEGYLVRTGGSLLGAQALERVEEAFGETLNLGSKEDLIHFGSRLLILSGSAPPSAQREVETVFTHHDSLDLTSLTRYCDSPPVGRAVAKACLARGKSLGDALRIQEEASSLIQKASQQGLDPAAVETAILKSARASDRLDQQVFSGLDTALILHRADELGKLERVVLDRCLSLESPPPFPSQVLKELSADLVKATHLGARPNQLRHLLEDRDFETAGFEQTVRQVLEVCSLATEPQTETAFELNDDYLRLGSATVPIEAL